MTVEHAELIAIGRKWLANSRLEEWFPMTAEELNRLRVSLAVSEKALVIAVEDINRLRHALAMLIDDVIEEGLDPQEAIIALRSTDPK